MPATYATLARVRVFSRNPVMRELLIFLAFVGLTAGMSWPWVCHLRDAVHDVGDPYTIAYNLWWDYHQTFTDPRHLFDATIFYPYRDTLAFSENDYGIALLFFPLFALKVRPLTVHSIATLMAFVLSGYGAFRLARTLTGSYGVAWVAGIVFAFVPYRFHRLPHLHYIFAGWLPLMFEALVLYARQQSWRRATWLGAAFLMNALTCITWFLLSLIPLALIAPYLILRYRTWHTRAFWWRAAVAFGLILPILIFFLLPYQRVATLHNFVRRPEEVFVFSALPINWLAASELNKLWHGLAGAAASSELALFPGLLPPLLTLAALLLIAPHTRRPPMIGLQRVFGPRLRRWLPPVLDVLSLALILIGLLAVGYGTFRLRLGGFQLLRASHPARAFVAAFGLLIMRLAIQHPHIFYALRMRRAGECPAGSELDAGVLSTILIGCGFAGSFGPNFFLYTLLMEYLWVYKSQRVPAHWAMLCYLGLALAAGLGARRVTEFVRRWWPKAPRGLIYVVLVGAILFEQRVAPLPFVHGKVATDGLSLRLKQTPMRGGLVELPTEGEGIFYYVLRAADHERPVITAASSFLPPLMQQIAEQSQQHPVPNQFVDLLESIPASYLVVHYAYLTPERAHDVEAMLVYGMQARRLRFIRSYQDSAGADLYAVTKTEPQARAEGGLPLLTRVNRPEEAFTFTTLPPTCRETGFFIYRLYKAAFGRAPTFAEFKADSEALTMAVRPDEPGWEERLTEQSGPFVQEWIERSAFRQVYGRQTLRQLATQLAVHTGGAVTKEEVRETGADSDSGLRAALLLRAVNQQGFIEREFNAAFVTLHYYGLLHRAPERADAEAWLKVLNQYGNYYAISRALASSAEARQNGRR